MDLTAFIDEDRLRASLAKIMADEMMEAAEPIIQQAVKDAEKEMRRRLGAMIISQIDSNFDVTRSAQDIVIRVKHIP